MDQTRHGGGPHTFKIPKSYLGLGPLIAISACTNEYVVDCVVMFSVKERHARQAARSARCSALQSSGKAITKA